jgi:hypothetical protein
LIWRAGGDVGATRHTVAALGRVRHCESREQGTSMAVELTGLSDTELNELVSITDEISALVASGRYGRAADAEGRPAPVVAATRTDDDVWSPA